MKLSFKAKMAWGFMMLCRIIPIQKNKIVFSSYFGEKYNDNPKAISDELLKNRNVKQVWILPKQVRHPDEITTVPPQSLASLYHLATAKVWVDNCRKTSYVRKRKGQFYIQTWHGGVGLKAVEAGSIETLPSKYVQAAENDSKMANAFISECEWKTKQYLKDFWYSGEIIKSGLPRSDIFFKDSNIISEKVRRYFNINKEKHIVLYAPTFRKGKGIDVYKMNNERLLHALEGKFGGEWCIIVRLHPEVSDKAKFMEYNDQILNGTPYDDINEILMASEILISDYSSCIFDALFIKKLVFLYTPDIETYIAKDRHLTFKFDELPVKIARNDEELENAINTLDVETYEAKRKEFINGMGYYSNGHAAEIIAHRIINEMGLEV